MKKNINYENHLLRNTNYYLLCTLHNLEKQKIENLNKYLNETEEPERLQTELENDNLENTNMIVDTNKIENAELIQKLKEKQSEYELLSNELNNLKIEIEVQKVFSEHKIHNLELAKDLFERDLLNKHKHSTEIETHPILENDEIIKKEMEIENLKKENVMLTINNQQLQFELVRSIKEI
jgi:hypothetical protein